MVIYRIRYGKKLRFNGVPRCESHAKFNIKSGEVNIGKGFYIRAGSYIAAVSGGKVTIGDGVFMNRNCSIVCQQEVVVGDHCGFGPNVIVYDHDHRFGQQGIANGYKIAPVIIEKNCWLGAGVIVLRGTHIGEGSVIGAGTIVKGEIPAHSLVTSERGRALSIVPIDDRQLSDPQKQKEA